MKFTYWIEDYYVFCTFDVEKPHYKQSQRFSNDDSLTCWKVSSDQLKSPDFIHNAFCEQINIYCKDRYFQ